MILPYEAEELELHLCKEEAEVVEEAEHFIVVAAKRFAGILRSLAKTFARA